MFNTTTKPGFGLGAQRRAIEKNDLPQVQAELAAYLQVLRSGLSDPSDPFEHCLPPITALIIAKEKIAANCDYNLSGERYREGAAKSQTYPSYPLFELCDIFNGSTPSKQEPRYWENGTVPWFTFLVSSRFKDEPIRLSDKTSFNFVSVGNESAKSAPPFQHQAGMISGLCPCPSPRNAPSWRRSKPEKALVAVNWELITRFVAKIQALSPASGARRRLN